MWTVSLPLEQKAKSALRRFKPIPPAEHGAGTGRAATAHRAAGQPSTTTAQAKQGAPGPRKEERLNVETLAFNQGPSTLPASVIKLHRTFCQRGAISLHHRPKSDIFKDLGFSLAPALRSVRSLAVSQLHPTLQFGISGCAEVVPPPRQLCKTPKHDFRLCLDSLRHCRPPVPSP